MLKTKKPPFNFLRSKLALLIFLVILGFVITSWAKLVYKKHLIDKEVSALKQEVSQMEAENQKMASLIKYLRSNTFIERSAREKFNLQKEGEKVAIITTSDQPASPESISSDSPVEVSSSKPSNASNPLKWWQYFFTTVSE